MRLDDAPALAIRLWQLATGHSARRTAAVVQLLGIETLWQRPVECPPLYVQGSSATITKSESSSPEPPKATLPMTVVDWIHWLSIEATHRGVSDLSIHTIQRHSAAGEALHAGREVPGLAFALPHSQKDARQAVRRVKLRRYE